MRTVAEQDTEDRVHVGVPKDGRDAVRRDELEVVDADAPLPRGAREEASDLQARTATGAAAAAAALGRRLRRGQERRRPPYLHEELLALLDLVAVVRERRDHA